jgi:hypothetical protein
MEELLNLTSCIEGQKVMYTAYKLLGEAKRWWGAQRNLLVMELGDVSPITWTRFKKEFDNRYFPRIVREAKAREFMGLVQGSMTMAQYAAKFSQLSRFVLYLIPDEEKKAKKFERGLNQKIQNWVMCLEVKNFVELVNKASIAEEYLKETTNLKENQKKR